MPKLNDATLAQHRIAASPYGFSATRLSDLGASEYTLASIITDVSTSVAPFEADLTRAVQEIVRSCKFSPRADNLLVRLTQFDDKVSEVHGFKLLERCNESDYRRCLAIGGSTALYDAAENGIMATYRYAQDLFHKDYGVNGIVFVLTDGDDNASRQSAASVRDSLARTLREEVLESLVTILVGVNVQDARMSAYLKNFKDTVGFTQYVEIGRADAKTLAKLAQFVSRSISAQSQALGTGGPSQSLTF